MNPGIRPTPPPHDYYNDVWRAYHENVLYDIVMTVRALDGPKYNKIADLTPYPVDTVVKYLRYAETQRYIIGKYGFFNGAGNRGGAKCWYMADPASYKEPDINSILHAGKVPPYPYEWLTLFSDHKDDLTAWLIKNAQVIYYRDSMIIAYIAMCKSDMEKEYKRMWADHFRFYSAQEKIDYLQCNLPSPFIMSDYGKKDSPRPIGYDRWRGAYEWHQKKLI